MGTVRNDITGKRFGRLVVLRRVKGKYWECQCDCGNIHIANRDHLGRDTNSCGCLKREVTGDRARTHGERNSRTYNLWLAIRARCSKSNTHERHIYYDRGIDMCEEWNDYLTFKSWALANGYDPTAKRGVTTIDRIDNDKGYSPENCRFVSLTENARNKRDTKRYPFHGEMLTTGEVEERTGTKVRLLNERMARGWDIERAAETPRRVMHYLDGRTNYDSREGRKAI